jgi:Ca2+-binding EF-hand superfamily protein
MVTKNLSRSKKTSSQSLYKVNKNNFVHKKSLVLKDDTNTHDNTIYINNENKNYIKENVNKNFDIFSNESFLEDEKERKYNIFQRYENPELTTNDYIRKLEVKTSKNKLTDYNIETEAKKAEDNIIHTYFPSTTTLKIDEKKEIKETFKIFAYKENSDKMLVSDIKTAMMGLGLFPTDDEIERIIVQIKIIKKMKQNEELKEITFDEFNDIVYYRIKNRKFNVESETKKIFNLMSNGKKEITRNDIEELSKHFDDKYKKDKLNELFETADYDKDGKINEKDFMQLMHHSNYT